MSTYVDADSNQVRADHDAAAAWARKAAQDPRAVILDTETTDLRGYICDIAIIRATTGEVLMNTLVNPGVPIEPGAQAVHGITDADVAGAPSFTSQAVLDQLADLIGGRNCVFGAADMYANPRPERRVLVYNAAYDRERLRHEISRMRSENDGVGILGGIVEEGIDHAAWECIMLQHAAWVGEWNEYRGGYRWHKLTGGNHRALGDCQAARARLFEMAGLPLV